MKRALLRISFSILLLTMFGGCSVNTTGLAPVIEGERYAISCNYDRSFTLTVPPSEPEQVTSSFSESVGYCFNGAAPASAALEICSARIPDHERTMSSSTAISNFVLTVTSAEQRLLADGPACLIADDTPPGVGVATSALSSSGAVLISDDSGRMLGNSNLSNLQAEVSSAQIRVSAKFAKWRHADTSGTGQVMFDAKTCAASAPCPLVLRHFEIDLNDFTIVRPTRLAKDVQVKGAKLYTIGNYEAMVDAEGRFAFSDVKAMVSGVVDGEKSAIISRIPTVITGRLDQYRGRAGVSPQRIVLNIDKTSPELAVRGSVTMRVNKYQARLRNEATARCLEGTLDDRRVTRASIETCASNGRPQDWLFERKEGGYQIKQPFANACLNLKTSTDNREGAPVFLAGCSGHPDQLWAVGSDRRIKHLPTGKCLNVHKGLENRDGGLVTAYACANTPDQRWLTQ